MNDGYFDFDNPIKRLEKYANANVLLEGSWVEQILLRNENLEQMCCRNDLSYTTASCLTEDRTSKQILESLKMSIENKIPIYVSGDGNCLFNAISLSLVGNEKLATQIRVLTCIEMVMNKSLYDNEKYEPLI